MEAKATVRERGRARRAALGADVRAEYDVAILEKCQTDLDWAHYRRVMLFLPIARHHEIDTSPLIRWIWENWPKVKVYVPRVQDEVIQVVLLTPATSIEINKWGIPEPVDGTTLGYSQALHAVFTPLLGFDSRGHRVGYGKGYYDQFFLEQPAAQRIGLGYECLLSENIIAAEYQDIRLHAVITEEQVHRFDH